MITAAHVIGRWGFLKNPRVLIAGQDLPAKIIKEGSVKQTDLTLLSIDEASLPVSLRLRRNPLCKQPPKPGENVIVVVPERTARSQIISPLLISPSLRKRLNTLIDDLPAASGSGVFGAERKCLMGIISRKCQKYGIEKTTEKSLRSLVAMLDILYPQPRFSISYPQNFASDEGMNSSTRPRGTPQIRSTPKADLDVSSIECARRPPHNSDGMAPPNPFCDEDCYGAGASCRSID